MRLPSFLKRHARTVKPARLNSGASLDPHLHDVSDHMKRDVGIADRHPPHLARHHPVIIVHDFIFRTGR